MWEKREIIYVLLIVVLSCVVATIGIVGSAKVEMLETENRVLRDQLNDERMNDWIESSERKFPI